MSSALHRLAVSVGLIALLCAGPARAGGAPRTAGWLLGRMAGQARVEARAATAARHPAEATTWTGWAGIYQALAGNPGAARITAPAFAAAMVKESRAELAGAEKLKASGAAAFYRAMVGFWTGLSAELRAGGSAAIHFPRREMLRPVAGLPETPWAGQAAGAAVQRLVLCNGLASRKTQCESQLAELKHEQALGLSDNGDAIVVQMTMCHRLEESWVKSCSGL